MCIRDSQHFVEIARQGGRDVGRGLVQYHGVGSTHALQIMFQHLGAGRGVLVGHQQPLPGQGSRQLAAFAARRRAQDVYKRQGLAPRASTT